MIGHKGEHRTTADTLAELRQRLAVLEQHAGVKPPVSEAPARPVPPMGNVHAMARSTQLISTTESRALDARKVGRAEVMRQHNIAGRYFGGNVEPANAPIPRASATGSVI
jgi:hypothetical protein